MYNTISSTLAAPRNHSQHMQHARGALSAAAQLVCAPAAQSLHSCFPTAQRRLKCDKNVRPHAFREDSGPSGGTSKEPGSSSRGSSRASKKSGPGTSRPPLGPTDAYSEQQTSAPQQQPKPAVTDSSAASAPAKQHDAGQVTTSAEAPAMSAAAASPSPEKDLPQQPPPASSFNIPPMPPPHDQEQVAAAVQQLLEGTGGSEAGGQMATTSANSLSSTDVSQSDTEAIFAPVPSEVGPWMSSPTASQPLPPESMESHPGATSTLFDSDYQMISFLIPAASRSTPVVDVLKCPDIRHLLKPRDSPFVKHNNLGTGFASDDDRVALNTLKLGTKQSSGATDMCINLSLDAGESSDPDQVDLSSGTCTPDEAAASTSAKGSRSMPGPSSAIHATITPATVIRTGPASAGAAGSSEASGSFTLHDLDSAKRPFHIQTSHMDRLCVPLPAWAVRAGPRKTIYYDPQEVTAAVVTCGGLCPGLNDVVQEIVKRLSDYGVPDGHILGIRYGFRGFQAHDSRPTPLTLSSLDSIQLKGGTVLGTSRGNADIPHIVQKLYTWGVNMLFVVGGDGGNKGAHAISQECIRRSIPCAVVGVPKSIDNDILLIDQTFGFHTAVDAAQHALEAAKVEAWSAHRGIGLVKLMGRQSGFIAMQASLASGLVDVCLIPEVHFKLEGPYGLIAHVERLLETRGHCVICVAEGAGQDLIEAAHAAHAAHHAAADGLPDHDGMAGRSMDFVATDPSGNPLLKDIGAYLKHRLTQHFKHVPGGADIKYIDPTYMVRAIPSNSRDHIYCKILAANAVDAAFAGFTGVTVGCCNTHFCLLPIPVITQAPRRVDPQGKAWNRLRAAIGQPNFWEP